MRVAHAWHTRLFYALLYTLLTTCITHAQELEQDTELPSNPALLTPEPEIALDTELSSHTDQNTTPSSGIISALMIGSCIGSAMGFAQFHTRQFFPYNWIIGFFVRILLAEAVCPRSAQQQKQLLIECAWTADWLVYGYLKLHALHLI